MYSVDHDKVESLSKLTSKTHGFYDCQDGRRYAILGSLWFEGKPFAVVESAGREGGDHVEVVITDSATLEAADLFIKQHCRYEGNLPYEVKDPDKPIEDLGKFYGHDFTGEINENL
jgi:hypothetical protein